MNIHYFDPQALAVYTSRPSSDIQYRCESFFPTRTDLRSGFILWMTHSNYDSAGPSEGLSTVVVDLYGERKSAVKMAKLIREYLDADMYRFDKKGRQQHEIEKDFFFAATTDRTPYLPLGWGTDRHRIFVDPVKVVAAPQEVGDAEQREF